ncbi:MAG: NADH-quinone oxidoreductase subunit NuoH [Anaerovibrio sp.]|uniref:NADH-quinone oxidoreductase subunit NuoH n=1 Tax=Anaerovibrio sp. TaxID=1872532 RepID=UPI001B2F03EF|nr:NADH-quinone oxidoreductase subunit NuoH [Anaerovibrio sp.]MBO5588792.1 NADH-quinone oxidoreductase subunit NuoH [Anaerovibrio sp.]MBO6245874.1 NADH-quinone oxidoreductase subunit NuoH [Anaerovibrio sp.]MBR1697979.1 NADH-quinone oxidoreductase subunit NuoH [Anaerovibrio sp.]
MHSGILYSLGQSLREILTSLIGVPILVDLLMTIICATILLLIMATSALVFTLGERKICAFIQVRIGPNRVGPGGLLQSVADMLKLMDKEDIVPRGIDKWLWVLSPILLLVPSALIYAFFPFDDGVILADVNVGLFLLIAITSQTVLPFLMGGYSSNSKYSLIGGMRTVAQMLGYEVPMVFALMGIVMITGSLKMSAIVEAQSEVWFIVLQPLAFLIYIVTALVESNRPPFNIVEGESEIIAGPFTEYTGMRWALFFLAEFSNLMCIGILTTTLFLGGWHGPDFLPGFCWFWIKTLLCVLFYQWVGWTFPRARVDSMLSFGWKVLLPIALINVLLTGVGIYVYNVM